MNEDKFEYAKGRYVNTAKIIDLAVYGKQSTTVNDKGEYPVVWRVAIALDVQATDKGTVYSDPFETEPQANQFAKSVPLK